jgi:hypothetical protein
MIKIFTWHIHGSYLYYLSQGDYEIYIPVDERKSAGYAGRGNTFAFGDNVREIAIAEVKDTSFDCILFQNKHTYLVDQYQILSSQQRQLPKIYLEHDPPWGYISASKHLVSDPTVLLVHVTHFNELMWDSGCVPTMVIEHGVKVPDIPYDGGLSRGLAICNEAPLRGRSVGYDLFLKAQQEIDLDLVGFGNNDIGLGEVLHPQLPEFMSHYRFYFHPNRYTSLGLSLCEAMTLGVPVVALATTEAPTVMMNEISGFVHTDMHYLIKSMKRLLKNRELAIEIGRQGREIAREKFGIDRFTKEWKSVFEQVINGELDFKPE